MGGKWSVNDAVRDHHLYFRDIQGLDRELGDQAKILKDAGQFQSIGVE
jgi:hypothetical protein